MIVKFARRRGRPAKKPIEYQRVKLADPLSVNQLSQLKIGVQAIAEVASLPAGQRDVLINEVAVRLPYAVIARAIVPEGLEQKRGPKPKLELPTLLVDCVKAWEAATGERPKIWETEPGQTEAVVCQIARVGIQVVHGLPNPYSGALHRAIKTARGTLGHPLTNIRDRLN